MASNASPGLELANEFVKHEVTLRKSREENKVRINDLMSN